MSIVIDTPSGIEFARLLSTRAALKLGVVTGLKHSNQTGILRGLREQFASWLPANYPTRSALDLLLYLDAYISAVFPDSNSYVVTSREFRADDEKGRDGCTLNFEGAVLPVTGLRRDRWASVYLYWSRKLRDTSNREASRAEDGS